MKENHFSINDNFNKKRAWPIALLSQQTVHTIIIHTIRHERNIHLVLVHTKIIRYEIIYCSDWFVVVSMSCI